IALVEPEDCLLAVDLFGRRLPRAIFFQEQVSIFSDCHQRSLHMVTQSLVIVVLTVRPHFFESITHLLPPRFGNGRDCILRLGHLYLRACRFAAALRSRLRARFARTRSGYCAPSPRTLVLIWCACLSR